MSRILHALLQGIDFIFSSFDEHGDIELPCRRESGIGGLGRY
jgi:hypothetical protein